MKNIKRREFIVNYLFYFLIISLFYIALKLGLKYLLPFVFGTAVAAVSRKLCADIKFKKVNKDICAVFTVILIYTVIAVVIYFTVNAISENWGEIGSETAKYFKSFFETAEKFTVKHNKNPQIYKSVSLSLKNTLSSVFTDISEYFASLLSLVPVFIIETAVTVISSVYIAKDYEKLKRFFSDFLKDETKEKISKISDISLLTAKTFLGGYFVLFLITFSELALAFLILKIPYFLVLALVIAVVDILPVLGTGTVLIPWGIISLLSGDTALGIKLIFVYLIVTLIRNFAEPHIIGKSFDVHPLISLFAVYIGFKAGGVLGAFTVPFILIVFLKYFKETAV